MPSPSPSGQVQGDRRAALLAMKLAALVRDHTGRDDARRETYRDGAASMVDTTAWVLADSDPETGLGPALAWAIRHGATALRLVVETDAGTLARRAAGFAFDIGVLAVDGRTLRPVLATAAPASPAIDERLVDFAPLIAEGGAEPVVEHGVLSGEVRGLEVCRAVVDPHLDLARLEVGVGAHDREAFQLMHGDVPPVEALRGVVDAVARHRADGADPHPLNRLAKERLLRWRIVHGELALGDGGDAGGWTIAEPPVPRRNVRDATPCVMRRDGQIAVCSSGVDLDAVPFAVDAGASVIVLPYIDAMVITRELAALARRRIDIVTV
jgi:hypothetical protein